MWRFHSPLGSLGASYQQSPTMTSSRPSLLTSATPTPSERKFLSRTIFFQVILTGFLSRASASKPTIAQGNRNRGSSQQQRFMVDPRGGMSFILELCEDSGRD